MKRWISIVDSLVFRIVAKVGTYGFSFVGKISPEDKMPRWNFCTHFPFFRPYIVTGTVVLLTQVFMEWAVFVANRVKKMKKKESLF